MGLFSLEQGKMAYRADFLLYGGVAASLAAYLLVAVPATQSPLMVLTAVSGLAAWTLTEYVLHRFVLHGMAPFRRWHRLHHQRPTALICSPTIATATLFVLLVFLPVFAAAGIHCANAFTFGMVTGYLAYATTHHALHHWSSRAGWFVRLKRRHAVHHRTAGAHGCYGVTSGFWDRIFGSELPVVARTA